MSSQMLACQLADQPLKKVALVDDPADPDKCCEQSAEFDFEDVVQASLKCMNMNEMAVAIFEMIKTAFPQLHESPDGVSQLMQSIEKVHDFAQQQERTI